MNLSTALTIFLLVECITISSSEEIKCHIGLGSDYTDAPLALLGVKNGDSTKLELAIPRRRAPYWEYFVDYFRNKTKDDGVEEFFACPTLETDNDVHEVVENWRKKFKKPEESKLFFFDIHNEMKPKIRCTFTLPSSIEEVNVKDENGNDVYCSGSRGNIYNVGYPVSKKDGTDYQFISIYKVCHSTVKDEGTLYTVHRIVSPSSMLLQDFDTFYLRNTTKCSLDREDKLQQLLYENKYHHKFVGAYDMPTRVWAKTTMFYFNYFPIPKNKDLITSMVAVDNFIRLFSYQTDKPLLLYSGTYQPTVNVAGPILCAPSVCSKTEPVTSFWRIIIDDNDKNNKLAVIVVTQHTAEIGCNHDTFICGNNRVMLKKYKQGGCTYTCAVDSEVIKKLELPENKVLEKLELPSFDTFKYLDLTFPRKRIQDKMMNRIIKPSENVKVTEFLGDESFENVLKNVDLDFYNKVKEDSLRTGNDEGPLNNMGRDKVTQGVNIFYP